MLASSRIISTCLLTIHLFSTRPCTFSEDSRPEHDQSPSTHCTYNLSPIAHLQPISHSPLSVRTWTTKLKSTCCIAGLSNQDCEHGEEQGNFHGDEQYESNQDDVRDREDEEETEDLGRFDSGQRYLWPPSASTRRRTRIVYRTTTSQWNESQAHATLSTSLYNAVMYRHIRAANSG
jgi:hypothetical protein